MSRARKHGHEVPESQESSDEAGEPSRSGGVDATPKRRVRALRPAKDRTQIVRATYESTRELEFRLSNLAKHLKIRKFDLVFKLLDQGCGGYNLDRFLKEVAVQILGESVRAA